MSFLKELSTNYYNDAKKLDYKWIDLVKKSTRQQVLDDVEKFQNMKMINEARAQLERTKMIDKELKQMKDEVRK